MRVMEERARENKRKGDEGAVAKREEQIMLATGEASGQHRIS
jgi:hypothetical protein